MAFRSDEEKGTTFDSYQPVSKFRIYNEQNEATVGNTTRRLSTEEAQLQRRCNELEREVAQLREEVKPLAKIRREEERYSSASRDARKMYGDITPGDQTHQDVILLYQNHFKSAFRNMPREFPSEDKFKIWQMCSDIFQACFDAKKDQVIKMMKNNMKESLQKDFGKCVLDESTRDTLRAFKMIMLQVNVAELKQKVKEKMSTSMWNEEMFDFVLSMIQTLDPVHYKSFLTKGELQDRPLHLYT